MKKRTKPKKQITTQQPVVKHGKLEFASHVIFTTIDIVAITAAAVVLHHVVAWGEAQGLPWFVIMSLKTLEYTAYAVDVLLSAQAIIKTAVKGFQEKK
jgi:hypothetical protein